MKSNNVFCAVYGHIFHQWSFRVFPFSNNFYTVYFMVSGGGCQSHTGFRLQIAVCKITVAHGRMKKGHLLCDVFTETKSFFGCTVTSKINCSSVEFYFKPESDRCCSCKTIMI